MMIRKVEEEKDSRAAVDREVNYFEACQMIIIKPVALFSLKSLRCVVGKVA